MIASTIKAVWDAISSYSPEPVPCPTCKGAPIVTIRKDEEGYIGHIECSPETRKIKGVFVNPGEHVHSDFSNPCKTPEEAYDSAVKTWNGHMNGTLECGKRFPETKDNNMDDGTSKRPWEVRDSGYDDQGVDIIDAEGARVCFDLTTADADLIVKAVNSYSKEKKE